MAHTHEHHDSHGQEHLELGTGATKLFLASVVVGLLGLVAAILLSMSSPEGFRRFYFAYLASYAFFLSLAVGGLFFILINFCVRAGWSVAVRRIPEALARTMPLLLVLSVPLLYSVVKNDGALYRWAQPVAAGEHGEAGHAEAAHGDSGHGETPHAEAAHNEAAHGETPKADHAHADAHAESITAHGHDAGTAPYIGSWGYAHPDPDKVNPYVIKSPFPVDENGKPEAPDELVAGKVSNPFLLQPAGWMVRVVLCLVALTGVALFYVSKSRSQDASGDEAITLRLNGLAPAGLIVFGLSVTFLAYDLLMSLDPVWYSTIFGGYFFAGSAISVMACTILVCQALQSLGYLKKSVNTEHYHDLSKFQFAFTFFWGYLAFSQFMLLWYSSQPESLTWLARRGASTAYTHMSDFGGWSWLGLALAFGKLLIPFAGLLSRHVKRNPFGRMFWASWILVFQFVDMYWLVGPELDGKFRFGLPEVAAFLGIGGLFVAIFIKSLSTAPLRPLKDPRLPESLAFHQSF